MDRPALALAYFIALFAVETADAQSVSPQPRPPTWAFFIGGGLGFSFADFGTQSVYNKGISDVYENGALIASGTADGPPVSSSFSSQSRAAPEVQVGFFRQFEGTNWLWGAKFSYSYLDMSSGVQNLVIPQFGTSTAPDVSTFTGFSVTKSYSVSIRHQLASLIFIGRSFGQGFLYAGAGPSLSQIKVELDDVVGYATINGVLTNISGAPQSFARTDWRFGPAVTAGLTYFLTPSLFIDAKYLFTAPSSRTVYITSPFNNPGDPITFKGTLIGTATSNVRNTQAVSIALNKGF